VPDDVVVTELLAATQAAVNHSRELLSIARRLLVNVEGGPDVPVEIRAGYWQRFTEMDLAHTKIQDVLERWRFLRPGPDTVQWLSTPWRRRSRSVAPPITFPLAASVTVAPASPRRDRLDRGCASLGSGRPRLAPRRASLRPKPPASRQSTDSASGPTTPTRAGVCRRSRRHVSQKSPLRLDSRTRRNRTDSHGVANPPASRKSCDS